MMREFLICLGIGLLIAGVAFYATRPVEPKVRMQGCAITVPSTGAYITWRQRSDGQCFITDSQKGPY